MSWRSVLISKGGKLSLQRKQMLICQDEGEFTVPLEDIAIVVVENRETVITVPLLSAFGQYGITLLTCDEQFLPCGQFLPFNQYHRQLKILKLQLGMSLPLKKQLWQNIIKQKILNQSSVLQTAGLEKLANKLRIMAKSVKSGDKDNLEAQSAALYFPALFGKNFTRQNERYAVNAYLNYAYSILRSAIARALVQYGWLPQMGIFHHNELNAFNLADDFIEPFRPLVDNYVWHFAQNETLDASLPPVHKHSLVKLLHYQMRCKNEISSVLTIIERCIASFQTSIRQNQAESLLLPEILLLAEHRFD